MKKRILTLLLALLVLLSLCIPAYASEAGGPWVVDSAGLLTQEEAEDLSRQIQSLRSELELEIVIVTTYGTGDQNVQNYADDYYDANGYGYGSSKTGILLLVDMQSREWYMSTCGDGIFIFTDYGLEQLGNDMVPWLSGGDYYRAFDTWVNSLGRYVDAFRAGNPIDGFVAPDEYDHPDDEIYYYDDHVGTRVRPFPIALVIGFLAALITIVVMRGKMNTARRQSGASSYLKDGSFRLRQRSDMFLYSRVSKRPRPQNNTSGGGSSAHRSSGGVSHGGRGGKF